jgi:hypothetical protein
MNVDRASCRLASCQSYFLAICIDNRFTGVIAGSDPQSRESREYEYNEECWQSDLVMRDAASKCGMTSLVSILPGYILTRNGKILNWFLLSSDSSRLGIRPKARDPNPLRLLTFVFLA